jgi:activating signal cointegrator 1
VKAITICQPFAHLILRGKKRVENRTWFTGYRGPLYIHAGKSRDWLSLDRNEAMDVEYKIPVAEMAFGAVVAVATLAACVHIDRVGTGYLAQKYPWLEEHEHTEGPWCFILEGVRPIGPWPWRGEQGLFDIDPEALSRVANESAVAP